MKTSREQKSISTDSSCMHTCKLYHKHNNILVLYCTIHILTITVMYSLYNNIYRYTQICIFSRASVENIRVFNDIVTYIFVSIFTDVCECKVLILDGSSEHVAHACWKIGLFGEKNPICDCFRSNLMP